LYHFRIDIFGHSKVAVLSQTALPTFRQPRDRRELESNVRSERGRDGGSRAAPRRQRPGRGAAGQCPRALPRRRLLRDGLGPEQPVGRLLPRLHPQQRELLELDAVPGHAARQPFRVCCRRDGLQQ